MNKKLRNICIGGGIAIIALFVSCKNFMQGEDILTELEKTIDYSNAQSAEIEISVSSDYVKNVYPGIGRYAKELKPTDTLDVSIEEKDTYQFIKWTAEPEESVSFEDCTAHSTKVTILNSEQKIIIKPVLFERPSITFSPSQLLENPRNSTIELLFSHPMQLTQEDAEKIEITSNGENVINNFEPPFINEEKTKIIFDANYENLIPVLNGIRTVEVSVPCEFYYETEDENKYQITLGQPVQKQKFSYKITPETSTKLNFSVKNTNSRSGTLNINGSNELSIGQSQNLLYTVASDYVFICWQVYDTEGKLIEKSNYKDYIDIEDENSNDTILTVKRIGKEFVIAPLCEIRPEMVYASPANGDINIVRNRIARITFSKELTKEQIKDYVRVYEVKEKSVNGEIELEKLDITNTKVQVALSDTGKTISVTPIGDSLYSSSVLVRIEINKELCDTNKASFEKDITVQFQTSSYVDSLAPVINTVSAGIGSNFAGIPVFDQYTEDELDSKTNLPKKIGNNTAEYYKVSDNCSYNKKINFYVHAEDIEGVKDNAGTTRTEEKVSYIWYRISKYKNINGVLEKDSNFTEAAYHTDYVQSDYSDPEDKIDGKDFKTIAPGKSAGCIFSYDLKNLPEDGFYRFDISTEDSSGNKGFEEEYWAKYKDENNKGNGYCSFFVLKDDTELETGTNSWLESNGNVDSDYVFKATDDKKTDRILRIPFKQSYGGIKSIDFEIKDAEGTEILDYKDVKVKYGITDKYTEAKDGDDGITYSLSDKTVNISNYYDTLTNNKGYLFVEGLHLGKKHGEVTVKTKLTDYLGKVQTNETIIPAYNDHVPPYFKGGAPHSTVDSGLIVSDTTYYAGNPSENVFPRKNKPGITAQEFELKTEIKNKDGVEVRWFYTAGKKDSSNFGVYLDANIIDDKSFAPDYKVYYYCHSTKTLSDTELRQITAESIINSSSKSKGNISSSAKEITWRNFFTPGTWSVVLVDEVGNTSPAYTFVVVKDKTQPSHKLDGDVDMRLGISLIVPSGCSITYNWGDDKYYNTNSNSVDYFQYWAWGGHSTNSEYNMSTSWINLCGAKCQDFKLNISFEGKPQGTQYQGKTLSEAKYAERYPSRTSSGIVQYAFNWAWADWNSGHSDQFKPTYPKDTNTANVDYRADYGTHITSYDGFGTWEDYTSGSDINWKIYHQFKNNGLKYKRLPPVVLCLKDGCGNLTWIKIDRIGDNDRWNWSWYFAY